MKKLLASFTFMALAASVANAANGTWNVNDSGLWSNTGNWLDGIIADDNTSTANFTNDITADRTLNKLVFSDADTATPGSWLINNNSTPANTLTLGGTAPTITVNALGTNKVAEISAVILGTGGLTKSGTGTLTLSGTNTYTGATTVSVGTIAVTGEGRINNTSGISIAEDATFRYAPSAPHTFDRAITGNGTIRLQYSGANHYYVGSDLSGFSGQVIVESGTGFIRPLVAFSSSTARLHLNGGAEVVFNGNQTWGELSGDAGSRIQSQQGLARTLNFGHLNTDATYAGNFGGPISLVKEGSGTQTFTGAINLNAGVADAILAVSITINAGTIEIGGAGLLNTGNYAQTIALTRNTSTFRYNSSANQTLSGEISGVGMLTKNGTSTLTLSGNNTYQGATTVSAGTLQIGDGTTDGSISASSGITNNATLVYNLVGSQIYNNAIGGTGSLTKSGAGSLTLGGTNTYTGATTVSVGTLLIDGSTHASSAVSVASGAIIGGNGTIGGNLTLANGALFAFDTANTLTLGGSSTFALDSTFGVASLRNLSGAALDWDSIDVGTYTLLTGGNLVPDFFSASNITNFGLTHALTGLGTGGTKSAYFDNGSLQLVVIPEPSTWALLAGSLTALVVFRRRRRD